VAVIVAVDEIVDVDVTARVDVAVDVSDVVAVEVGVDVVHALQETGHISATVLEKRVPAQVNFGMIQSKQSVVSASPLHFT